QPAVSLAAKGTHSKKYFKSGILLWRSSLYLGEWCSKTVRTAIYIYWRNTHMATLTAGKWTLDPAHSEAMFAVRDAGISRVRVTFDDFSGIAAFTEDLTGSEGQAKVGNASV